MSDFDGLSTEAFLGRSPAHPSPFHSSYLMGFLPRRLKDLFKLTEWLFYNSGHIFAASTKLSDYSVTEVVYESEAAVERSRMKDLMENQLRIKQVMKAASRDRMIYGNSFIALYMPFVRKVRCTHCGETRNISRVDYKFKWKELSFHWLCPTCKGSVVTTTDEVIDLRIPNQKLINILRLDPKIVDISYNPITGQSIYYYSIPADIKRRVRAGEKHLLNTMPVGFLKAIKDDKIFEFAEGQVFHMKTDAPAGIDAQWGFPAFTPAIYQFYYTQVLRRANEAISLEHTVPFRVLHPAQTSSGMDPTMSISMGRWMEETKQNIKRWRRDPLHIMFSPVALGVTEMGGNGRALMTLGEVEAAENNILATLGVPREFLYGGLSFNGSAVTLRMLENQLLNQTRDLEEMMNWVGKRVCDYLGWPTIRTSLTPFKLIDDVQQKNVLLNLNANGAVISNTTLAKVFGYDLENERKLRMQEALDESRFNAELQTKVNKMQSSVSAQARAKAQQGSAAGTYDIQSVMGAADQMVQQFLQLDPGSRRSQLETLKSEDPVMYAVARMRLEDVQREQATEARTAVKQQSGQGV